MASQEASELTAASALDGSELLHVVQDGNSRQTTTGQFTRNADRDISLLAFQIAVGAGALILGAAGNHVVDRFTALTYVDNAGAANLDTSAAGVLLPTAALSLSAIAQGTGTAIGDMTTFSGVNAAFNGVTISAASAGAGKTDNTVAYIGKDYGSAVQVIGFEGWGVSSQGFSYNATPGITLTLVGGDTSDPTAGTEYKSVSGTDASSLHLTKLLDTSATGFHRYWWIKIEQDGAVNHMTCAEVIFYEGIAGAPDNLSVESEDFTALTEPISMSALVLIDEIDAAVPGTDYTLEFSRDGRTNWSTATLTDLYTRPDGLHVVETNAVDVSGQPSGTAPAWRFKTVSGDMVGLAGIALKWAA